MPDLDLLFCKITILLFNKSRWWLLFYKTMTFLSWT